MIKLVLASAGSGKTTFLVKQASIIPGRVLIVTFTLENEQSIKERCVKLFGLIPENIEICTWFSFLLRDWIRPYQNLILDDKKIQGLILDNGIFTDYVSSKKEPIQYYLTPERRLHSSRIAKLAFQYHELSLSVLPRLGEIYSSIFIDEVQDLSGYDYDLVALLGHSFHVVCVGDYRQKTYTTHKEARNRNIESLQEFCIKQKHLDILEVDNSSLYGSYRCVQPILDLASLVFNEAPAPISKQNKTHHHSGCYIVLEEDVEDYLVKLTGIVQLTYNRASYASSIVPRYNMGESKGLEFDHVLIWPTDKMQKWLLQETSLEKTTLTKLYVSITRAQFSVAFVMKCKRKVEINPDIKTKISFWVNPKKI